jgi:hypothetical protein
MGKMGSSLQSSMSGQMNPTNMARNAYGSTSPTSGYSQQSANMPMAYGPGGTQTQRNPYMYQLYGNNQQQFTPGGAGNFGTISQPSMGGYSNFMSSPLGQKFGMLMNPYRPAMNPAYGMQSYGQPATQGDASMGTFQDAAQTASGVDQNAGGGPAPEPKREMPSFLVPYSQAGVGNTSAQNQPLHGQYGRGGAAFLGTAAYNNQSGRSPRVIVDDKYRSTNPLTGELNPYQSLEGMRARATYSGGNEFNEEFLYDPTTNTLYSPGAAKERFGY